MRLHGILEVAGLSDVGLQRQRNEDAIQFDALCGVMVLADGMGGHQAGEVASEIAALTISADLQYALQRLHRPSLFHILYRQFRQQSTAHHIIAAVKRANSLVYNIAQTRPNFAGMATTLVLGVFTNNQLFVGHVGDSRVYRLRQQQLQQMTEDHSIVQEQINAGLMTAAQAKQAAHKNLVTRAIGIDDRVELTLNVLDVAVGDVYLFCSDGLTDLIEDAAIESLLNQDISMVALTQALIALANEKGGVDNTSVILAQVKKPFANPSSWLDRLYAMFKYK
jgi:serine/threonine protein phosphatase PrpC